MKKLLLLLCSFCGILQADNLIKNGQFTEQNADGSIAHWKIWPAKLSKDAEVALDSTVSRSGGRSVRITNKTPWLYTRVDQLRIPCKPHTRYIASCWVKGKDIHTERRGGQNVHRSAWRSAVSDYPVRSGTGLAEKSGSRPVDA